MSRLSGWSVSSGGRTFGFLEEPLLRRSPREPSSECVWKAGDAVNVFAFVC